MATNAENVERFIQDLWAERDPIYRADIGEIILRGTTSSDVELRQRAHEAVARRPKWLMETTSPMIKALSDEHALPVWGESAKDHVIEFDVHFPGSHTETSPGLKIYSIPDDTVGFNTSSTTTGQDNSKRWVVYLDRGTNFGAAFDYRGTAYANGRFEPDNLRYTVGPERFDTIVKSYFERDDLVIDWSVLPNDEERVAAREVADQQFVS